MIIINYGRLMIEQLSRASLSTILCHDIQSCAFLSTCTVVSPQISLMFSLSLVFGLPLPLFPIIIPHYVTLHLFAQRGCSVDEAEACNWVQRGVEDK